MKTLISWISMFAVVYTVLCGAACTTFVGNANPTLLA